MLRRTRRRKRWRLLRRRAGAFLVSLFVLLWGFAIFLGTTELVSVTWSVVWVGIGLCVLSAAALAIKL